MSKGKKKLTNIAKNIYQFSILLKKNIVLLEIPNNINSLIIEMDFFVPLPDVIIIFDFNFRMGLTSISC